MGERALTTLLRLELGRMLPLLRRGLLLTAAVALAVGALRGGGSDLLWLLLLGSGLSHAVQVPAGVVRDRLGGELAVLVFLPVPPATVAAGKFGAAALMSGVGALHWAFAAALILRDGALPLNPVAGAAAVFVSGWVVLATGSFVAIALAARFDLETLTSGPAPAAVLVLLGAAWFVERWAPRPWPRLGGLLHHPWLPVAATGAALLAATIVSVIAFRAASVGIRRVGEERHGPRR